MQFARRHRIAVVAVTALGLGVGTSAAALASPAPARPSAAQQPAALSTGAKHPVIVLLKNQHPELPVKTAKAQRKAATAADQAPLVSSAQATGAQDIKKFSVINGFSAKMTDAEAAQPAAEPGRRGGRRRPAARRQAPDRRAEVGDRRLRRRYGADWFGTYRRRRSDPG